MEKSIELQDLSDFEKAFDANPENGLRADSVIRNGIDNAAFRYQTLRHLVPHYSLELDAGKVCNQKQSGRCWMFAAYNVFRLQVMKNLNLDNMELSQAYPLFYDKLEKSNFFLESILETLDEETSSRLLSHLLKDPIGDGGQWNMFVALTKKYGVVPKQLMPETASSENTRLLDKYVTLLLRKDACLLRKAHKEGKDLPALRAMKKDMLQTIYRILCIALGKPPVRFTFETRAKDGSFVRVEDVTPTAFFERYVQLDLDRYVSVINAPTADKPFYRSFTVSYLGNVVGHPVRYVNLPIDELKSLVLRQLESGEVVWFGSDVNQFLDRAHGFMSMKNFAFDQLFDASFEMTKEERLDYGESLMTHAMVLTGVNLDKDGRPDRWKVENSWGDKTGYDGFYAMDDDWFDQFVYQAVIDKKFLTSEQLKAYESEPIVLQPWDPMGSLAL